MPILTKKVREGLISMNTDQNTMMQLMNQKGLWITLGAVGGVTLLGVAAAMVWNSKQLRAMRAVKRTSKILYQVGTAMRNVAEVSEL